MSEQIPFHHTSREKHPFAKAVTIATAALAVAISLIALPTAAASPPDESESIDYFHKGLGHDTPVPDWAKGKGVRFLVPPGQGPAAELRKKLIKPKHGAGEIEAGEYGWGAEANISYHGGWVQTEPHIHLIFWGSNWNKSGQTAEVKSALELLYSGLSGSAWQGILTQYFDGLGGSEGIPHPGPVSHTVTFNPSSDIYVDTSVAAPTGVNHLKTRQEIEKVTQLKGWMPAGTSIAENINEHIVVLPAPETTFQSGFLNGACAFHWYTQNLAYEFVPYVSCGGTNLARSISGTASHEYSEVVTDPRPNENGSYATGWAFDVEENGKYLGFLEIADICQGLSDGQLENGAWVNQLRDNYTSKCSLSNPSPPQFSMNVLGATAGSVGQATIEADIEPAGHPTSYRFAWGKSPESCTAPPGSPWGDHIFGHFEHWEPLQMQSIGSGTGLVHLTLPVSGIEPNVQYCIKVETKIVSDIVGTRTVGLESHHRAFTLNWRPAATTLPGFGGNETATLNGLVNPRGLSTTYRFEYDTSKYEKEEAPHGTKVPVPDKSVGAGTSATEVSNVVTGLKRSTVYHYRVVATNSEGTTYGEDQTVSTWGDWSIKSTPVSPTPEVNSRLIDVSCPSSTLCMGLAKDTWSGRHFLEKWDGSSWSIVGNTLDGTLKAISCPSTTWCITVGNFDDGVQRSWTFNPSSPSFLFTGYMQVPSEGESLAVNDVSCTAVDVCTAVGTYVKAGKTLTLAERYSGSPANWALQSTPNPESGTPALKSVSCASATSCVAVGELNVSGTAGTFAERWDGTSWSISTPANPAGATSSVLAAVSCTASNACTAVGNYKESTGYNKTLVERFNGTSWSVQTSPNPAESKGGFLLGVSCTSSTSCIAVGRNVSALIPGTQLPEEQRTLVEAWSGSEWQIQSSPNTENKLNSLVAVSCSSTTACAAVGNSQNGFGGPVTVPLGQRYE
jgi:hypothetical protein